MFKTKAQIKEIRGKLERIFHKIKDCNRNIQRHDADIKLLNSRINEFGDTFDNKITSCDTCGCLIYKNNKNKGESTIEKCGTTLWMEMIFPYGRSSRKIERLVEHYFCKLHHPDNKTKPKTKKSSNIKET